MKRRSCRVAKRGNRLTNDGIFLGTGRFDPILRWGRRRFQGEEHTAESRSRACDGCVRGADDHL